MAEYISREAVEQVLCGIANGLSVGETEALKTKGLKALYKIQGAKEILNAVDNDLSFIPAADVQPVKRGFWKALMMSEETGWDLSLTGGHDTVCEYVCSVCGKPNIVDEFGDSYLPNFCPNCGTRMIKDGDTE